MGETFNSHLTDDVGAYDSQNHTMIGGGLVTWMYNGLGGIAAASAGYRDITFRPGVESGLERVDCSLETVRGTAVSNWSVLDGRFPGRLRFPSTARRRS